jgi:hypothetical protein
MAYASRSGRARVSSSSPEAFGVCQRCGFWFQRRELKNQMAWRGATLLPTWVFVCNRCYDTPQEQDRAFVPPADPIPIQLALPEDFNAASADYMGLTLGATVDPQTGLPIPGRTAMSTADGVVMGPTPVGRPVGYALEAVMPLAMSDAGVPAPGGIPIPVLSMLADGSPVIRVTTNGPHGLAPNQQIAVAGTVDPRASGMFSVSPLTATLFSYGCYDWIPAGSMLSPETMLTLVVTA